MNGFTVGFFAVLLPISWRDGYAIASRMIGHEAAQRNLRSTIPFYLSLFVIGIAIAFVLPLLGKYGLLGYQVLIAVFSVTYPLSWLWRRRQAGSLVLDLGRLRLNKLLFWCGVFQALLATMLTLLLSIWIISERVQSYGNPENYFSEIASALSITIMGWSMAILFVSLGLSRLQLRENGICCQFIRMSWQRITSYAWERAKPNILTIWFKPRFPFMPGIWGLPIPAARKDEVDRILAEYLPDKFRA